MIKKTICLIFFVLSTTVYAQDDVLKVTLRVGKHQNFYRFVFICEKPEIIHSINVNLLNNGKIKLTFPESFEIEFEGRLLSMQDRIKDLKTVRQNLNSFIIETSKIQQIKVLKYEDPLRLVIDAYFEEQPAEEKVKMASILIDPGHGGKDTGIQFKDKNEKDIVLYIAKELASKLTQKGIITVLTRASDEEVSLRERIKIENRLKPLLFLSIHLSSAESFIIYTSPAKKNISKEKLSKILLNENKAIKIFINKLKESFPEPLYQEKLPATVLKESSVPALMIEIPKRALIFDKDYLNKITDVFVQTIEQNLKQKARSDKANNE